jgi:hypothetical protein
MRTVLTALLLMPLAHVAGDCLFCEYPAPQSPKDQSSWLEALQAARNATWARIGWKGGVFDVPELRWTQTSYIQVPVAYSLPYSTAPTSRPKPLHGVLDSCSTPRAS